MSCLHHPFGQCTIQSTSKFILRLFKWNPSKSRSIAHTAWVQQIASCQPLPIGKPLSKCVFLHSQEQFGPGTASGEENKRKKAPRKLLWIPDRPLMEPRESNNLFRVDVSAATSWCPESSVTMVTHGQPRSARTVQCSDA